jgi:hypothetical protein
VNSCSKRRCGLQAITQECNTAANWSENLRTLSSNQPLSELPDLTQNSGFRGSASERLSHRAFFFTLMASRAASITRNL